MTEESKVAARVSPLHDGTTSLRIKRANHSDDVLAAEGLYARINRHGSLIVFSGSGLSMGLYPAGDWTSVEPDNSGKEGGQEQ